MRITDLRSLLEADLYLELKRRNVLAVFWQPEQNLELLTALDMSRALDSNLRTDLEGRFFNYYYLIQAVFNSYGHKFHILTPSPWPFFTALSTLGLGLNAIYIMHSDAGVFGLLFAFCSFLFCLFLWWRDVLHEAVYEDKHTSVVRQGLRMGMRLFIISEVMFFFSFFWAYFHHALSPSIFIGGVWPPRGVLPFYLTFGESLDPSLDLMDTSALRAFAEIFYSGHVADIGAASLAFDTFSLSNELRPFWDPYVIPLAMTIVLITSGITVTAAHTYVRLNNKKSAFLELFLTLTLAVVFLFLQIFEYVNSPFSINSSVFGSTFFMTTGFHGFHVLIGGIFLSVWAVRLCLSFDSDLYVHPDRHVGLESAIWYWHFVDVVWIFLFFSCYWWLVPEANSLVINFNLADILSSSESFRFLSQAENVTLSFLQSEQVTTTSVSGFSEESSSVLWSLTAVDDFQNTKNWEEAIIFGTNSFFVSVFCSAVVGLFLGFVILYFRNNISPLSKMFGFAPVALFFLVADVNSASFISSLFFQSFLFFFELLFFFFGHSFSQSSGIVLIFLVFCPVALAVLAAFTNTDRVHRRSLWFSRRLEYYFYRYFFFHLAVIVAAPYRYSPLDVHWIADFLFSRLRAFVFWLDEQEVRPLTIIFYPFLLCWRFWTLNNFSWKRLTAAFHFLFFSWITWWTAFGSSAISTEFQRLSALALSRCDLSAEHGQFRPDGSLINIYQPVNYVFYLSWLDKFDDIFLDGFENSRVTYLDVISGNPFRIHPLKLSFFFRFFYGIFFRSHRMISPGFFEERFNSLFYGFVRLSGYYLWRLIFIRRELVNALFHLCYLLDYPVFTFSTLQLPRFLDFTSDFVYTVLNSKFWFFLRKFLRLFIRRHEFRVWWYTLLGNFRGLNSVELKAEYAEKLLVRKRYPWEAWREQVWFVSFFNALYLRAQKVVNFDKFEIAPFARALRNPQEPRFVTYTFSSVEQNSDLIFPGRVSSSSYNESLEVVNPCLTHSLHRIDAYFCAGGGEYEDDIYIAPQYDLFGFRLPSSYNPYGTYYSTAILPSVLLAKPVSQFAYFEEERNSPVLYKNITTFYRWYQLSVFFLLVSVFTIIFLAFLRLGLVPILDPIFSAKLLNLLSFTASSYTWFTAGSFTAFISWRLTEITGLMLAVVAIVSTCVFIYAKDYMAYDAHRRTFLVHLLFFTAFMNIFIVSDDFVTLFIGWEGVGLSSFFLINFWNTRVSATKAAIKAMLVNKVGDCALLAAIVYSHLYFGTTSFSVLFDSIFLDSRADVQIFGTFTAISGLVLLLFIGAMAKSAQFGLHSWLPDAMEGPTPVSALIHAATMVTAGVLLLIKFSPLVSLSQIGGVIVFVGILTAVFAGSVALVQHDIKKIIAYSTCSQLGLMVMACGLGFPLFAFFHLVTHAFFKALLFLSAGVIVHAVDDEQDIRRMGGLQSRVPLAHAAFFIGTLCITGFPFFSGFYSKELIILSTQLYGGSIYILCCLATMLTVVYSLRLYCYVMLGKFNGSSCKLQALHQWVDDRNKKFLLESPVLESWNSMLTSLLILSSISSVSGYVLKNFFEIFAVQLHSKGFSPAFALQSEYLSTFSHWTPFCLSFFAGVFYLGCFFSRRADLALTLLKTRFSLIYAGLVHKWFFDHLINKFIIRLLAITGSMYGFGDKGFIELIVGSKNFFLLLFSTIRSFLSKFIFGVPFAEAFLFSIFLVSFSIIMSIFVVL